MGGDDLGSDDGFWTAPVKADASSDEDDDAQPSTAEVNETQKRSNPSDGDAPQTKKRKRGAVSSLRDLGPAVLSASVDIQAKHLSDFAGINILPQHLARTKECGGEGEDNGYSKRVQSFISKKKLKKWKTKGAPCVVIVCISARRAVQVLKELAPLNVRAAKLFAKHIAIEDQVKQLEEASFGIAVGTPHRLLTLAEQGALSFKDTQCLILDTYVNDKQYTVCSLPDTACHTQEILKKFAHEQCQLRKDFRLAFA